MTDDTSKSESKLTEAKQFKKFSCKHYSVQLKDVKIKNPGMTDDTFKSDSLIYDTQILNHIKDAIICLKNNEEQANQAKILTHLKKKMPSNPKIINLTEGCLEACLKRAVNEGVLSVQLIFKKTDTRVYRLPAGQFTLKCHTAQVQIV